MKRWLRAENGRVWVRVAGVLAVVVGLMGGAGRAWAQEEKLPKAEKILERSIEAQGGREAFDKLTSRVSKGTLEIMIGEPGPTGPAVKGGPQVSKATMTRYEAAPNKRYVMVDFGDEGKIEQGSDGETHWELPPMGEARILEGEEKVNSERQSVFNAFLHWRELYQKVECTGKEDVGDRSCYKVEMTPATGAAVTMYFDRKTGLPVKTATVRKGDKGDIQIQTVLDDFKSVDGVMLAHKTTRQVTGGGPMQTITTILTSVEHNSAIPADRFALPDQVKMLKDKPKAETKPAAG